MILDQTDIVLIRRAIATPGAHQREIYRPYLEKGKKDATLAAAIKCLESCGFLRLSKTTGTVQVYATQKARRHLAKLNREAAQCKQ